MKQIVQTRVNHSIALAEDKTQIIAEIILIAIEPQYKYIDGNVVKTLKTTETRFDITPSQLGELIESLVTISEGIEKLDGLPEIVEEQVKLKLKD